MMTPRKTAVILAVVLSTLIFAQQAKWVEGTEANGRLALADAQENPKNEEQKERRVDRFGDPLPLGAMARLGTLRFRHPFWVSGLAYTPDGTILASACLDGAVRLWDAGTGRETRLFRPDARYAALIGVAITPDGKTLIATENRETMHVWDLASGKERWQLKGGNGFALALSADGKSVAKGLGGARNQQLSLWDLEKGQLIHTLGATNRSASALAFSPDGKLLAAGDGPPIGGVNDQADTASSVRLWDPTRGRQVRDLTGHTGGVTAVAFSSDGKLLASASHDATVRLWNTDGQLVRSIAVPEEPYPEKDSLDHKKGIHFGGVLAVAFSPDGQWLASGGFDGFVRLWDVSTGKALHAMPGHGREVTSVVFSRAGKVLASGSRDHTVRLWDPTSGKELQPQDGHHGPLQAIAISPDCKLAAAVCQDRSIHLWSLDNGQRKHILRGHTEFVYSVAFAADGRTLASASADKTIRIWDVIKGHEVRQLLGHKSRVHCVAFTPVDNLLLSLGADQTLRFWDASNGKEHRRIQTEKAFQMSVSRDGRIVGANGAQAQLWEVATGKELRRITNGHDLALAPDGKTFSTRASDGSMQQWNIATGEVLNAFPGSSQFVGYAGAPSLIYSPAGRLLAAKHGTGIGLWEIATGKLRRQFTGHQGSVGAFAFSPDGRSLLTGSEDTTLLIWDLARRQETQPARLAPADLEALWRDLGGDDADRADRAISTLAARADQGVPFLNQHHGPVGAPDPKRLSALIADLDSRTFATREKAAKELQRMGERAAPALKDALEKPQSLETRRRIENLLPKQGALLTSGEPLQSLRAVEALERIDSLEARRLLQRLASGSPQARLTQEAGEALNRLERPLAK